MTMDKIVLVEDDAELAILTEAFFERRGIEVVQLRTVAEALAYPDWGDRHLAFVDYVLPDGKGSEVLGYLRHTSPEVLRVLLTGMPLDGIDSHDLKHCHAIVEKGLRWMEFAAAIIVAARPRPMREERAHGILSTLDHYEGQNLGEETERQLREGQWPDEEE